MTTNKTTRRRRPPRKNTTKVAGRSFTRPCAEMIIKVAKQRGQSPSAVITDVLERWVKRRSRKPNSRRTRKE